MGNFTCIGHCGHVPCCFLFEGILGGLLQMGVVLHHGTDNAFSPIRMPIELYRRGLSHERATVEASKVVDSQQPLLHHSKVGLAAGTLHVGYLLISEGTRRQGARWEREPGSAGTREWISPK